MEEEERKYNWKEEDWGLKKIGGKDEYLQSFSLLANCEYSLQLQRLSDYNNRGYSLFIVEFSFSLSKAQNT